MSVDLECCRKCAYEHNWLDQASKYVRSVLSSQTSPKYIHKLLLRYLMIKWSHRNSSDDVLFVHRSIPDAVQLIQHELEYLKIRNASLKGIDIARKLDEYLHFAYKEYVQLAQLSAPSSTDTSSDSKLVAIDIRYSYLQLSTLGLRMKYEHMGYLPTDPVCEAFASTFNHYFDVWCSAFPDLECQSFFTLSASTLSSDIQMLVVNPPFDVMLMNKMFTHLYQLYLQLPHLTFFVVLPNWKEWQQRQEFEQQCFAIREVSKQMHAFWNDDKEDIYACDVVWCYFGHERTIDEKGKVSLHER